MVKTQVHSDKAPAAIGPYSQAISCQGFVFVSGQIALNQKTGQVEGSIQDQTRTALTNLGSILEAAGSGLDLVVKTTVFMADMNDFAAMNEVYKDFFGKIPPRRDPPFRSASCRGMRRSKSKRSPQSGNESWTPHALSHRRERALGRAEISTALCAAISTN